MQKIRLWMQKSGDCVFLNGHEKNILIICKNMIFGSHVYNLKHHVDPCYICSASIIWNDNRSQRQPGTECKRFWNNQS